MPDSWQGIKDLSYQAGDIPNGKWRDRVRCFAEATWVARWVFVLSCSAVSIACIVEISKAQTSGHETIQKTVNGKPWRLPPYGGPNNDFAQLKFYGGTPALSVPFWNITVNHFSQGAALFAAAITECEQGSFFIAAIFAHDRKTIHVTTGEVVNVGKASLSIPLQDEANTLWFEGKTLRLTMKDRNGLLLSVDFDVKQSIGLVMSHLYTDPNVNFSSMVSESVSVVFKDNGDSVQIGSSNVYSLPYRAAAYYLAESRSVLTLLFKTVPLVLASVEVVPSARFLGVRSFGVVLPSSVCAPLGVTMPGGYLFHDPDGHYPSPFPQPWGLRDPVATYSPGMLCVREVE
eukprot:TRINITY_DN4520_c0_g1_i1.p1 TRINITY_DN4520_c0_g1~~TRINITY_DN4520_c0_g1_i1.p1  ORF type:complete len:357 (+),score=36.50 TRINITY_DN4520_c0_g1_i1:37-1071(+)